MTTTRLFAALGITFCVALGVLSLSCKDATLVTDSLEDDPWAVIEYPAGQEVTTELKPTALASDAKGIARVVRSENETTINLDVSGVTGESTQKVYVVDTSGNATLLGILTMNEGSGNLVAKTALNKFMIVVSPDATLSTMGPETTMSLRSTVPSGFTVLPRENVAR